MTDKLRDAAQQAMTWFEWFHKGNSIESPTSSIQCTNALRAALAQQDAQVVPLTEKQRVYLAQAWAMLEDYAADQRQAGNDSIADGADASAHEIKLMLIAAPTPPAQQDAQAAGESLRDLAAKYIAEDEAAESSINRLMTLGRKMADAINAAPTSPAQEKQP